MKFTPEFAATNKTLLTPNVPTTIYFQVISNENSEAIEFAYSELIEVNTGKRTLAIANIKPINNGIGKFTFTPVYNGEGSALYVNYYLKIVKTSGETTSKEFELPKVDKNQMMSVYL